MITLVALAMVVVSGIAIIAQIVTRLTNPGAVPSGFTTLIVLMLLIGGIQLLFLGVIGSYIAHIYEEVKRRPSFIVESILNHPEPRSLDRPGREDPP
jgi:dolichol-phosphate mannosyltransferase